MCASLALLIMACMMMMLSRALAALSLPNTPSDPNTAAAGSTRKHANGGGEAGKRKSATDGSYGMSEAARRGDGAEKCAPNDDGSKCAINVRDLCADGAVHVLTRTDVSCKANPKRRNRALFPSETSARLGKRSGNASSPLATGCFNLRRAARGKLQAFDKAVLVSAGGWRAAKALHTSTDEAARSVHDCLRQLADISERPTDISEHSTNDFHRPTPVSQPWQSRVGADFGRCSCSMRLAEGCRYIHDTKTRPRRGVGAGECHVAGLHK